MKANYAMSHKVTIEGCSIVLRTSILGHTFREIDCALYVCERCGLVVTVDKDLSPIRGLENAAIMWHKLGRACA